MKELRVCAWPSASASPEDLSAIHAAASPHAGAATVASCQRIEVIHRGPCACGAPGQWQGYEALLRLAEVAAGLHSVVLGEEQVLGQVRTGLARGDAGVNALAADAIAAARQLRAETQFHEHTGHLLDRAMAIADVAAGGEIVIVGAGAVGRLLLARAHALGFSRVTVAARRPPEGPWFDAERTGFVRLEALAAAGSFDVVVTALGSSAAPLSAAQLPAVRRLAIDLGTPRNIEPGALGVRIVTIARMLEGDGGRRHADARRDALRARLRELLDARLAMTAAAPPHVGRLRLEVERIRRLEAERILRLHPELPAATVETITRSLVNQIFHRPTERLRATGDTALGARVAALFAADPQTATEALP